MTATATTGLLERFAAQRDGFARDPQPALATRLDRLDRLRALVESHQDEIIDAIASDFGRRSSQETRLTELFLVTAGIKYTRRHLRRWMRPRRVPTPLQLLPGRSRIERQPVGVAGIISPWNYPVQLALLPAVAALAAGNRVMLKPSELTPATSALLQRLVSARFAADELVVITGGADIGAAFSQLPFDHLFFTGSTAVGRKVALAAAANLTPVTLELGGKSPALIHADADIDALASRLAVGKWLNAGQTCIAPDYVLAPEPLVGAVVRALRQSVATKYPRFAANPDYTSIINDRHVSRLVGLLDDARSKGATILSGDATDDSLIAGTRQFAPTLVLNVDDGMALMQEEIFGPILPIESYGSLDDAIARINARPRPLAMYMFGGDRDARRRVLDQTLAGGVTIDDTLWHFCNEALPFGGIGASGIGAYHGESGFLAFSHQKAVFTQPRRALGWMLYPPYGKRFEAVLKLLKRIA